MQVPTDLQARQRSAVIMQLLTDKQSSPVTKLPSSSQLCRRRCSSRCQCGSRDAPMLPATGSGGGAGAAGWPGGPAACPAAGWAGAAAAWSAAAACPAAAAGWPCAAATCCCTPTAGGCARGRPAICCASCCIRARAGAGRSSPPISTSCCGFGSRMLNPESSSRTKLLGQASRARDTSGRRLCALASRRRVRAVSCLSESDVSKCGRRPVRDTLCSCCSRLPNCSQCSEGTWPRRGRSTSEVRCTAPPGSTSINCCGSCSATTSVRSVRPDPSAPASPAAAVSTAANPCAASSSHAPAFSSNVRRRRCTRWRLSSAESSSTVARRRAGSRGSPASVGARVRRR
jgi:hypothetical protein